MPEVDAFLGEIASRIDAEDPYNRLSGTVFVDAQAMVQWIRHGVLRDVLDLLPIGTDRLKRFRTQQTAYKETIGVVAGKFGLMPTDDVHELLSHHNLLVDQALAPASVVTARAVELQNRLLIEAGEDPTVPTKEHLGEAEILAMIEQLGKPALFVSADKTAVSTAQDLGIAAVRPLSFTAGVVRGRSRVTDMWAHTCTARQCTTPRVKAWDEACAASLQCASPQTVKVGWSPVADHHTRAADTLRWMREDLDDLIRTI